MLIHNAVITGSVTLSNTPLTYAAYTSGSSPVTSSVGQAYFDIASEDLQITGLGTGGGVWASGGALITTRTLLAGAGTQNAALAFGGAVPTVTSCT